MTTPNHLRFGDDDQVFTRIKNYDAVDVTFFAFSTDELDWMGEVGVFKQLPGTGKEREVHEAQSSRYSSGQPISQPSAPLNSLINPTELRLLP